MHRALLLLLSAAACAASPSAAPAPAASAGRPEPAQAPQERPYIDEPGQGACARDAECFPDDVCLPSRCVNRQPGMSGGCPDVVTEWQRKGASCVCQKSRCTARWPR